MSSRKDKHWTIVRGYATKVPFTTAALVAVLIFGLQDHITPLVGSYDLCRSEPVLSVSNWVIPKILDHCARILDTSPAENPSMDIVILLDMWNVCCFILYLIYSAYKLVKLTEEDLLDGYRRHWRGKRPSPLDRFSLHVIGPIFSVWATIYTFVWSPLTYADAITYFDSSLSNIVGAGYQAMVALFGSSALFVSINFFRMEFLLRRDQRNKEKNSKTKEED